jgi:galactokinase
MSSAAYPPDVSADDPSAIPDQVLAVFRDRYGPDGPVTLARAPGRVNLIGDHTDYNDGFVLPMTLEQAVYVALRPRSDGQVRLYSVQFEEEVTDEIDALPVSGSDWNHYVEGVAELLRKQNGVATGFDGVVYGSVPVGAGLSSSAALEVASLLALQSAFDVSFSPVEGARLCQQVEHKVIGVQCGIMDQFASRIGSAEHALFLDCRSLAYKSVPLDLEAHRIVVVDSTVQRALASSKYNERRAECEQGVAHFQQIDDSIQALRDVSLEMLEARADGLDETVRRRCRHVVTENARVEAAAEALREKDYERLGTLMNDSHASLRDLYEVSSEELNVLVETAQSTNGVLGARMTGAGFGGCTVNLVHEDAVSVLRQRLTETYKCKCDRTPTIYVIEQNTEAGVLLD